MYIKRKNSMFRKNNYKRPLKYIQFRHFCHPFNSVVVKQTCVHIEGCTLNWMVMINWVYPPRHWNPHSPALYSKFRWFINYKKMFSELLKSYFYTELRTGIETLFHPTYKATPSWVQRKNNGSNFWYPPGEVKSILEAQPWLTSNLSGLYHFGGYKSPLFYFWFLAMLDQNVCTICVS